MPVTVISDRDTRFTSRFYGNFHEDLGTKLQFTTAYHPQMDGQSERTIQTLEDMLRACVFDFGGSWDMYLPLAEFSFNNNYQASVRDVVWGGDAEPLFVGVRLVRECWEALR